MAPTDKQSPQDPENRKETDVDQKRRAALRKLGRYAAVTPPVVTLLMSARPKRAAAISAVSSRMFKQTIAIAQLQRVA